MWVKRRRKSRMRWNRREERWWGQGGCGGEEDLLASAGKIDPLLRVDFAGDDRQDLQPPAAMSIKTIHI